MYKRLAPFVAALALAACVNGTPPAPAEYDFGPAAAPREEPPRLRREITVASVTAPAWLDSPALVYRLAYRDASQPRSYDRSIRGQGRTGTLTVEDRSGALGPVAECSWRGPALMYPRPRNAPCRARSALARRP